MPGGTARQRQHGTWRYGAAEGVTMIEAAVNGEPEQLGAC
jgi:hypothetical protein